MAGAIVHGQCVDAAAAPDFYFSMKPGGFQAGLTSYEVIYTKVDGVWNVKSTSYSSQGVASPRYEVPALVPTFGVCDESAVGGLPAGFDYTILGALFAFAFSVVVGLWLFGRSAGSIVNIFKPK